MFLDRNCGSKNLEIVSPRGTTDPGHLVTQASKLCMVALSISGILVWNLFEVIFSCLEFLVGS